MVVGNGLIAKAFKEFEEDRSLLFFCSGVSNSMCKDPLEFEREQNMLLEHISSNPDKTFIYFSTCSILDPSMCNSLYVRRKLEIERLVSQVCKHYYIFRLSNVVGRTSNTVTVLNFLYNSIKTGQHFELWKNSNRNLIDVDHAAAIVREIVTKGGESKVVMNVANEHSYEVPFIVAEIEEYLGKKGVYTPVDKGVKYTIPVSDIQAVVKQLAIDFGEDYLATLLAKYYTR